MKPYEAFGVVVRSAGLLLLVSTANMLLMAVAQPGFLILMIPMLAIGIWLLRGAPVLVDFAYPKRDGEGNGWSTHSDRFDDPEVG